MTDSFYEKYKITIILSSIFLVCTSFVINQSKYNGSTLFNLAALVGACFIFLAATKYKKREEVTDQEHVADTYSQAVEKLSSKEIEELGINTRLRSIYALEQVARENKNYHPMVMEFLCDYVRRHSPVHGNGENGVLPPPQRCSNLFNRPP